VAAVISRWMFTVQMPRVFRHVGHGRRQRPL